jgi:hypothetical protein
MEFFTVPVDYILSHSKVTEVIKHCIGRSGGAYTWEAFNNIQHTGLCYPLMTAIGRSLTHFLLIPAAWPDNTQKLI